MIQRTAPLTHGTTKLLVAWGLIYCLIRPILIRKDSGIAYAPRRTDRKQRHC